MNNKWLPKVGHKINCIGKCYIPGYINFQKTSQNPQLKINIYKNVQETGFLSRIASH